MLAFADKYSQQLLTVVLTQNYRSTQPILDAAKILIGKNEERLVKQIEGLSKDLLAANTNINSQTQQPFIHEYETQREEMIGITLQVQALLAKQVSPNRIGIIFKENKYGEELSEYFKLSNIPAYSKRSFDLLKIPLAKKILLLLKYLVAEHDIAYGGDEMLFEILHHNWFNIPPIEVAKLSIEVASKGFGGNKTSLRQLLFEKAHQPPKDLFSKPLPEGMKRASAVIEKLMGDAANLTLQQLFETCIREAGILSFIMQSDEKIWLLQVLTGLFDFIKEETKRNPLLDLPQFIDSIELMQKEALVLPLAQVNGSDKGVNLMTVHGSKGLEFEYVFFVGCNTIFWEKKKKPGGAYTLPDTLFISQPVHKEEEELRRLFYVALTRAEQHLYLSFSRSKNDGKSLEPSMFIAEIQDGIALPIEKINFEKEVVAAFSALQFKEVIPEIENMEADFITHLLDKFVMNVTALNNYLRCPLAFYFQNLVRVPSGKSEATEFGSSVHYALQKLFEKMQQSGTETFSSKQDFIKDFEWFMYRHRENFTKQQFARKMEYGQEVLANYYDRYLKEWKKIVTVERNIRNVVVEGIPIKGKLDKLEFDGNMVNVVDYKTGDPDNALSKIKGPNDKETQWGRLLAAGRVL